MPARLPTGESYGLLRTHHAAESQNRLDRYFGNYRAKVTLFLMQRKITERGGGALSLSH